MNFLDLKYFCLNLGEKELQEVPEIKDPNGLVRLCLQNNLLTHVNLPFANLRVLILKRNKLQELNIEHLTLLRYLDCSFNLLEKLPEYLGKLPLDHLNLSHNLLTELPLSFCLLKLEYLNLKSNQMVFPPMEVCFGNEIENITNYLKLASICKNEEFKPSNQRVVDCLPLHLTPVYNLKSSNLEKAQFHVKNLILSDSDQQILELTKSLCVAVLLFLQQMSLFEEMDDCFEHLSELALLTLMKDKLLLMFNAFEKLNNCLISKLRLKIRPPDSRLLGSLTSSMFHLCTEAKRSAESFISQKQHIEPKKIALVVSRALRATQDVGIKLHGALGVLVTVAISATKNLESQSLATAASSSQLRLSKLLTMEINPMEYLKQANIFCSLLLGEISSSQDKTFLFALNQVFLNLEEFKEKLKILSNSIHFAE